MCIWFACNTWHYRNVFDWRIRKHDENRKHQSSVDLLITLTSSNWQYVTNFCCEIMSRKQFFKNVKFFKPLPMYYGLCCIYTKKEAHVPFYCRNTQCTWTCQIQAFIPGLFPLYHCSDHFSSPAFLTPWIFFFQNFPVQHFPWLHFDFMHILHDCIFQLATVVTWNMASARMQEMR